MKKFVGIFIAFSFLVACVPQPKVKVMRYIRDTYRPTNNIEVLHTKPVKKDYIEIAEISIRLKRSTREYAVTYLREKAKELGANAIILLGERSRGAVALPVARMIIVAQRKELYAIAIKYK